jgi:hypothetical protein
MAEGVRRCSRRVNREPISFGKRSPEKSNIARKTDGGSPNQGTKGNRHPGNARFQAGELESSSGQKVKNPKQAIAIGLREAGASKYESKQKNRANLKRTKVGDRQGAARQDRTERARDRQKTRAELYAEARRRGVPGRSKMTKRELQHALD